MKNILICFFILINPVICDATEYYVKNGGDDNADGLSDATAWATINKVNNANLQAGDIVYFNKGDTWDEKLNIAWLGEKDNYITFTAYGTGSAPIIRRINSLTGNSYLIFDGLHIQQNEWGNAVNIVGGANLIFRNVEIEDLGYGGASQMMNIKGDSVYGWAENIYIYDNVFENGYNTCNLSINARCKDIFIYDNISYGSGDNNIQIYNSEYPDETKAPYRVYIYDNECYNATNHGIEIGWDVYHCYVYNNYIYNNQAFGVMFASTKDENLVYNNLFLNNSYGDIKIQGGSVNSKIYNNTFIVGANTQKGIWVDDTAGNGSIIKNNIFYKNITRDVHFLYVENEHIEANFNCFYAASDFKITFDEVEYYSLASYQTATGQDQSSIASDPLLDSDYVPQEGSPTIDAGEMLRTVGGTKDYRGLWRSRDDGLEIGAIEYFKLPVQRN